MSEWFELHFAELMWGAVATAFGTLSSAVALMYRQQLQTMREERDWLRKELDEEQEKRK